jgi:hypothetical protein
MEGWLNLRGERELLDAQMQEAASGPFVAEPER